MPVPAATRMTMYPDYTLSAPTPAYPFQWVLHVMLMSVLMVVPVITVITIMTVGYDGYGALFSSRRETTNKSSYYIIPSTVFHSIM